MAVLAALALLALVAGVALVDDDAAAAQRPPGLGPQGHRPQFKVRCELSHSANDDPIVHPGQPGASHLHDFFGSTIVDASSTPADLLDGPTSCQQKLDTASYWAPALFDHGEKVDPVEAIAYYRPAFGTDPATVEAYPHGLVMIAGDHLATEPQPLSVAAWHCGASPDLASEPPTCPENAPLGVRIAFPSCWDGERLDSSDHRSHVAYADARRCPVSHPVPMPELVFEIRYPVTGDGHDLMVASGPPVSAHADFMNAWDQDKLEQEVRTCLNKGRVCGVVSTRSVG
jgi:hypothetical protein